MRGRAAGRALLGGLLALLVACSGPRAPQQPAAATSSAAASTARPTRAAAPDGRESSLRALLARHGAAVLGRDRAGFLADIDPQARPFRARQERAFRALSRLPVATWSYEYAGMAGDLPAARAPDAVLVRVVLRYALRGYDRAPAQRRLLLTVVRRGGRDLLAGDSDDAGRAGLHRDPPEPWDLGEVRVVPGRSSLVIGVPNSDLAGYAAEADRAVGAVRRIWTHPWPQRVVVYAPRTVADMARVLGVRTTGLQQVAAVTTGQAAAGGAVTGDRIVVNPETFPRLPPLARRVVLTHESTHVAARSLPRHDPPLWLAEGFADYVAYRDTGVPVAVVAADLLERVRAGGAPRALPRDAEFDPARSRTVALAYIGAWLACRLLAKRHGEGSLVGLYHAAATGDAAGLAARLHQLGTDERRLTADWRAYLTGLARDNRQAA